MNLNTVVRHSRRSLLARAGAALVSAAMLAGCGAVSSAPSSEPAPDSKVIGVSMSFLNQFYAAAVEGMKDEAEGSGYELVVLNANSNSSQQVNQVQNLLSQNVGAVIFAQLDAASGGASLSQANSANTPVIAVDQVPAAGEYLTYIGSDSVQMGKQACDFLFKQMEADSLSIVEGVPGSSTQKQRSTGCEESLDANSDIDVVSTTSADWDQNKAANVFANVLTANRELGGVFAQNDDMALGAIKAMQATDRTGIPIVSVDGFPAAFDAIENGSLTATISQQPYLMGQLAVRDAIKAIEGDGDSVAHEQIQKAVLVTQENVDEAREAKYYGTQE